MQKIFFTWIILLLISLTGCVNPLSWIYKNDGDGNTRDVEDIFPLALGGVAPGWDIVSVDDDVSFEQLRFTTDETRILHFEIPDGFSSFEEARSAKLVPISVGTANGEIDAIEEGEADLVREFMTITPPQELIQILIGEARGQLAREAILDENGVLEPGSISRTGEAVAAVIRNRVEKILVTGAPALFAVEGALFDSDPPASEYEAVIEAEANDIFQFSPVDPDDINHDIYLYARERTNFDEEALQHAYDQATTTAAFVFSEEIDDPTGGAFGFYSPTEMQYNALEAAFLSETTNLPENVGTSDAEFPAFAPIQILILSDIATRNEWSDIPSFVFIRSRMASEPAVIAE